MSNFEATHAGTVTLTIKAQGINQQITRALSNDDLASLTSEGHVIDLAPGFTMTGHSPIVDSLVNEVFETAKKKTTTKVNARTVSQAITAVTGFFQKEDMTNEAQAAYQGINFAARDIKLIITMLKFTPARMDAGIEDNVSTPLLAGAL